MKIQVDYDLCESNAVCVRAAPEVFVVDESDRLMLLANNVDGELLERVKVAVRRCPRHALKLIEVTEHPALS